MKKVITSLAGFLLAVAVISFAQVPNAPAQLIMTSGLATPSGSGTNSPESTVYTLEIAYPKAAGVAPLLDSNNRAYFAYTGLTYEIPLVAIGGSYPYEWSLSNAPAGMTVESYTSPAALHPEYKIVWTNPTSNAANIQVTVTDALNATDSETYSITVGTTGWYFVDSVNDGTGDTGTVAAPFDDLAQLRACGAGCQNSRVYFRTGTYTMASLYTAGVVQNQAAVNEVVDWNCHSSTHGFIWIAYPGETPTIDFEYTGTGEPYNTSATQPYFNVTCGHAWVSGITFYRAMMHAIRFNDRTNDHGAMAWNNTFDTLGPGQDGANAGFLMWSQQTTSGVDEPSYFDIAVANTFDGVAAIDHADEGSSGIKVYGVVKPVIVGNLFNDIPAGVGNRHDGAIAMKGDVLDQWTIRSNKFTAVERAIAGNQAGTWGSLGKAYGEIAYNLVNSANDFALELGAEKIDTIGQIDVYRNTFVGPLTVQNLVTADGPYNFKNNVLINADEAQSPWACIQESTITDSSRVTITGHELCNDSGAGVVDANGALTGSSRTTYLGTRGYEIP